MSLICIDCHFPCGVATGMKTEFGKIAQMLQTVETGRTLQVDLDKVGRTLARAAFVVVAIIERGRV